MKDVLPDRIKLWIYNALLGEIYPSIRAIAASFDENRELFIKYYLDRDPTDEDHENIEALITEIMANTSSSADIENIDYVCVKDTRLRKNLEPLGGFVYVRKEHC